MKTKALLAVLSLAFASISFSQSQDSIKGAVSQSDSLGRDLAIKGIYENGANKIRWGTGNTAVWMLIRQNGVLLTRQESAEDSAIILNNGQPIRVWDDSLWEQYSRKEPASAQVVTLLKHSAKDQKGLSDYALADLEQNRLTSLLLLAEFKFEFAQGLALAFVDSAITSDGIYRYQILIADPAFGDTLAAGCYVSAKYVSPLPPVYDLSGISGDRFINLEWSRLKIFSGYFIERTISGKDHWERLNLRPLIFADNYNRPYMYQDSVANYVLYEYRVLGVDAYERSSPPSEPIEVMGRDLTPPQPPYALSSQEKPGGAEIYWKNQPPEPDLAGYGLLKSRRPDDDYRPVLGELLPPGTTMYFDSLPNSGTYFYRLVAADTSGNISVMSVRAMVVIDDTIPPAPPTGLTAIVDTSGQVMLKWVHNAEDDVEGYRVYRMITGGARTEYFPLSPGPITDSTYIDTLMSSLRDNFGYYVKCVDFAGNYSDPSREVRVQLPDMNKPATPIIENYSVTDSLIIFSYISPSRDVMEYQINRFKMDINDTDLVVRTRSTVWSDTSAVNGIEYYYNIIAIDSANNESLSSKPLYIKSFHPVDKISPDAPEVKYQMSEKVVNIKWVLPEDKSATAIVFRRQGNGAFVQLSPRLNSSNFIDKHVSSGTYEYAVKIYYEGWGGTNMGKSSIINIP